MKFTQCFQRIPVYAFVFFAACALQISVTAQSKDQAEVFSSPVMDLGIVVGDLEKSAKFYSEVLGCKAIGFAIHLRLHAQGVQHGGRVLVAFEVFIINDNIVVFLYFMVGVNNL